MRRRRQAALFGAGLLAFGLMAGCAGSGDTPKETEDTAGGTIAESETEDGTAAKDGGKLVMSWWGNQVRNEGTTEALGLYTEQTGVDVEGQFYQWDDYWNKMATSAAGNSLPDIIQMDSAYIAQYVENGEIIDLTPYIEDGTIDTSNISDTVMDTGKVDGKVYGMVAGLNAGCMMYNKTLTDELGIEIKDNMTIDEFIVIAQQITEETGYRANIYNTSFFEYWARAEGIPIVEAKAPVDSYEPYVALYQLIEDGIQDGWHITPDCVDTSATETDPLIYGSGPETMAWCTINGGSNLLKSFQESAPEGMEVGITTIPTSDPKKSNYLGVSQFYCISSDCEDPVAAAELINWLLNSEECNEILLAERGVPASNAIADALVPLLDDATVRAMDYVVDVIEANCSPKDPPAPDGSSELSDTQNKIKEAIGYGEMTAEQGAQEYYNKMIELWGE